MKSTAATLDEDQEEAAVEAVQNIKEKQKRLLESLDMEQYAIKNDGFDEALRKKKKNRAGEVPSSISLPSTKKPKKFDVEKALKDELPNPDGEIIDHGDLLKRNKKGNKKRKIKN